MRYLLTMGLLAAGCASHGSPVPTPIESLSPAAPTPASPSTSPPADPAVEAIVSRRRASAESAGAESTRAVRRPSLLAPSVVEAANFYLEKPPSGFRDDCSGFVCAVYARTDVPLSGSTESLWAQARTAGSVHKRKRPFLGDLAFFDNTYDRNRNGRLDDDLTHIAVVVDFEDDGTIVLAHRSNSKGRSLLRMNLDRPGVFVSETGRVLNDYLRGKRSGDPAGTRYLAGELWRGFATVHPSQAEVWSPY